MGSRVIGDGREVCQPFVNATGVIVRPEGGRDPVHRLVFCTPVGHVLPDVVPPDQIVYRLEDAGHGVITTQSLSICQRGVTYKKNGRFQ